MEVHLKIQLINPYKENDNSETKYWDSTIIQFNEMQFQLGFAANETFRKKFENFSLHLRKMFSGKKSVVSSELMNGAKNLVEFSALTAQYLKFFMAY